MSKINYQVFEPYEYLTSIVRGRVEFHGIFYGATGMRIEFRESEGDCRYFSLNFKDLPTALRIANESLRLASLPLLPKKLNCSFFIVKNSEFFDWLNMESLDIYKNDPIFHLAIITDEWIDLICNEQPVVIIGTASG